MGINMLYMQSGLIEKRNTFKSQSCIT